MAIDIFQTLNVIETMENYLTKHRPPPEIRDKLDLSYKIENQIVIIHEIRPNPFEPKIIMEPVVAKATYVKSKNHWRVFWMRADLKWHSYLIKPTVPTLKDFLELVEEDANGCFFG